MVSLVFYHDHSGRMVKKGFKWEKNRDGERLMWLLPGV